MDAYPHIDYQHSIDTLPMFEDDYADLIYASHVMAYFDYVEIIAVLEEWRRVLKPGGVLRLSTPDFEKIIQVYNDILDLSLMFGFIYGRYETNNGFVYYRMIYDYTTLKKTLIKAGFKSVHRYDWRKTVHKDYDDYSQAYLPHMDKENGVMMSLNVEAVK